MRLDDGGRKKERSKGRVAVGNIKNELGVCMAYDKEGRYLEKLLSVDHSGIVFMARSCQVWSRDGR